MNVKPKRQSSKIRNHKHSALLSHEENSYVLSLIEPKCLSLCTTVVQLYTTDHPAHSYWIKRHTGILCFIKNSIKRSYFFRLYCTKQYKLVWEQELYLSMEISNSRPYLITFEGEKCLVALNFSSVEEATEFYKIPTEMNSRRKKIIESKISRPQSKTDEPIVELRKSDAVNHEHNFAVKFGADRRLVKKKIGIDKRQIGAPSNFEHVVHVGFSKEKGFDGHGQTDVMKQFLVKAGVTNHELQDRKTVAFIEDFITKNNVLETIQDTKQFHNNAVVEQSPQFKPVGNKIPERPIQCPTVPLRSAPPKVPAPVFSNSAIPPPPPPMPVLKINELKLTENVVKVPIEPEHDSRSNLMNSIRQRAILRKVNAVQQTASNTSDNVIKTTGTDALAIALRRALESRSRVIRSSDESDNEKSGNSDWEE